MAQLDVRGPFTDVKIADADDDGHLELITLAYESEEGYGSAILTVFDAITGSLEWQCNADFFGMAYLGQDIEVTDIDNDGETEIIVSGTYAYHGKIWVIDGKTHIIETSHYSSNFNSGFYAFTIGDPDNDGQREYIASTSIIFYYKPPKTWETEWTSQALSGSSEPVQKIVCTDIDDDNEQEIIFMYNNLSIIDGVTRNINTFPEIGICSFDIYDMNNDGLKDIVVGTLDGKIGVYHAPRILNFRGYPCKWTGELMIFMLMKYMAMTVPISFLFRTELYGLAHQMVRCREQPGSGGMWMHYMIA